MSEVEREPRTHAGQLLLIGFGVGREDYPGRDEINDRLRRAIVAIEDEAEATVVGTSVGTEPARDDPPTG